mmetsp:Transcript_13412/g.29127  ORF Transcript_13412/g.29127 Transcript_13412/m.29127 type:complete len:744 (+) Transcript_13412:162-2393(+)|eukprot:CAMPEP_0172321124 /NCGR_PEP_ID=MMETSP1058-20130122/42386_1 /TAXON_ID=83371 /ORGANISM="Detonula confervacea, Strain CCMP 353" /LENGTH=743 /DNA_ID=CAMNT_0013036543 /DNA_START=102 /DNA_END=2333 /DNA_ORIENTATION=+
MQAAANQGEGTNGGWGFAFGPPEIGSWRCGLCLGLNSSALLACKACTTHRPQDARGVRDSSDDSSAEGNNANPPGFSFGGVNAEVAAKKRDAMEEVQSASKRLKTELARSDIELQTFVEQLDRAQERTEERYRLLQSKKTTNDESHGDPNALEDDVIEINAGGKIIAAKRGTLCQIKGSHLGAIFSGRWDNKLQSDNSGRIFLDVNPKCFQAIVDYLHYLKISPADHPLEPPSVSDEYNHILMHQIKLFGLEDAVPNGRALESNIITNETQSKLLHDWLNEDGSDGEFQLLYRSSRDGSSGRDYHQKCDNKGCTITVIQTTTGMIAGGYSDISPENVPFGHPGSHPSGFGFGAPPAPIANCTSAYASFGARPTPNDSTGVYRRADNAFLFVFGQDLMLSSKMKVKHARKSHAMYSQENYGPTFGSTHFGGAFGSGQVNDLRVSGSSLSLFPGNAYDLPRLPKVSGNYTIEELEVFQVVTGSNEHFSFPSSTDNPKSKDCVKRKSNEPITMFETSSFSKNTNNALNTKLKALKDAEEEISFLENSFEDEENFIISFACGDVKDVITLNVSGTEIATKRSSLRVFEESVLARQFDDTTWTKQRKTNYHVMEWSADDVNAWVEKIVGIPDGVVGLFKENEITGRELIALGVEGLKMLGVERTGTLCLLLDEIKKLEKASRDVAPLIEHSPYCFGKIIDYLRLKQLHAQQLVDDEPQLPNVREMDKSKFQMTVNFFFPGESARLILG